MRDAPRHIIAQPDSSSHRTLGRECSGFRRGRHGGPRRGIDGGRVLLELTTLTDIYTQWTESRAVWNRSQHLVQQRIAQIEAALPFWILGFDSDNGGEFLNWHLFSYPPQMPGAGALHWLSGVLTAVTTMRVWSRRIGRTCVNWSVMGGWKASVWPSCPTNPLCQGMELFIYLFCPVMKHLRTEVEGSRKKRVYDPASHAL